VSIITKPRIRDALGIPVDGGERRTPGLADAVERLLENAGQPSALMAAVRGSAIRRRAPTPTAR
jgi:hypothetical protein